MKSDEGLISRFQSSAYCSLFSCRGKTIKSCLLSNFLLHCNLDRVNYTPVRVCVLVPMLWFIFFLSRNSSSSKMLMNRIRRTCRATWTEWSPTPGNWNLKSRTMPTRVRTCTQHMGAPRTSTFTQSFSQSIFFNAQSSSDSFLCLSQLNFH